MADRIQSRVNVLGVGISPIDMDDALGAIARWIAERRAHYICVTPAHAVIDCQGDPELRRVFNASGLTTPDGMGIVWLLRAQGYSHVRRVYGPDLLLAACEMSAERGYRHFYYGGAPGVASELAERLRDRFPGLQVAGAYSPPFRPPTPGEDRAIIARINAANADIVWVGISSPKQERWMSEHVGRVTAPVLVGVGAAFDFLSGRKRQAPHWMQRSGLEWLFRLLTEPRRLWRRYIRYPLFVLLVLAQASGIRRYSLD